MQKIEFIKMHGLGNDFVIIDRRYSSIEITKEIINKLSNRKTGAGCDQLITIEKGLSDKYDARIQIYNSNGDTAEACGNGTRCVAKLLFDEKNLSNIKLQSLAGILIAEKTDNNLISVNLGKISYHWEDIPIVKKLDTLNIPIKINNFSPGVAINIGNPHVVFFGKNIDTFNLNKFGPQIENNSLFPNKTNVEIVEVINRKLIKMRVWERGAGITLACGSGACAAVYAGMLKKLTDNEVEVKLVKGSLYIKIQNNEAIMIGPAEISYRGYIEL
jgi:diaminopimelate epimerase